MHYILKISSYIILLTSSILLLTACGGGKKKDGTQVKYETQIMKPETRVYNLYFPAALHGITEVEVYPQVSGIIRKVNFTDGIKVSKGQTLFVIDQTDTGTAGYCKDESGILHRDFAHNGYD